MQETAAMVVLAVTMAAPVQVAAAAVERVAHIAPPTKRLEAAAVSVSWGKVLMEQQDLTAAQGLAVAALEEQTALLTLVLQAVQAAFMALAVAPEEHLGQEALELMAQSVSSGRVLPVASHQLALAHLNILRSNK
jgi:hypothetical protein